MSNPFANARIERYTHSRRHAQTVVETALLVCEAGEVSDSQLVDLEGAVDALSAGQFQAATLLAEAAIEGRSKTRSGAGQPVITHSIAELWTLVANLSLCEPSPSVGQESATKV